MIRYDDISRGELGVVLGPTGSGKTTQLLALAHDSIAHGGGRVGFVSFDTGRPALLRTFAQLDGVFLDSEVSSIPGTLRAHLPSRRPLPTESFVTLTAPPHSLSLEELEAWFKQYGPFGTLCIDDHPLLLGFPGQQILAALAKRLRCRVWISQIVAPDPNQKVQP